MLKIENIVIALGILLIAIPLAFSFYADYSQAKAMMKWEESVAVELKSKASATPTGFRDKRESTDTVGLVEEAPAPGESIALLDIPSLGKKFDVCEGTSWSNLTKGPARISETALIGAEGSSVISGHRTMYGAPFRDLDKLNPGDVLNLITKKAVFKYEVVNKKSVRPDDMSEVSEGGKPRLILSTCDPMFSAKRRLLIICELIDGKPLPAK